MTITRDAGSEKGVSWVASSESSIHNVLNTSSCLLHAPLQASLLLSRGTGSPTFTRATKSWGFNELGYLKELSSGCAFFGGARLVGIYSQNLNYSAQQLGQPAQLQKLTTETVLTQLLVLEVLILWV